MRLEPWEEPEPPYSGPFVILRPCADGLTYSVSIEPVLATGEGAPRTFDSKHEAWWQAQTWFRQFRLPLRDLSNGWVGAHHREK